MTVTSNTSTPPTLAWDEACNCLSMVYQVFFLFETFPNELYLTLKMMGCVRCFDLFENQEREDGYNDNPITALYCYSPFTFA